jgi:hypothetical protein
MHVRKHWSIENQLHWQLDVAFRVKFHQFLQYLNYFRICFDFTFYSSAWSAAFALFYYFGCIKLFYAIRKRLP